MGSRLRRLTLALVIGALSAIWLNATPVGSIEPDATPAIPLAPNSPDRANVIGPEGGTVVTPEGRIQITVPPGALTAPAWVLPAATLPYGNAQATTAFEVELAIQSLIGPSSPVGLASPSSLRLTVLDEDAARLGQNANSLSLKSGDRAPSEVITTKPEPGVFEASVSSGGHFALSSDATSVGDSVSRIAMVGRVKPDSPPSLPFRVYSAGTTNYIAGPGNILWHQADQHAGAASYVVPIPLLAGPGGFKPPDPNLTYYSSRVDEMKNANAMGSWAGVGWDVNIPAIRRDPATNRYYLEMNGTSDELIPTGTDTDGSTKWSTRNEQYQRIRSKTVDSQHAVFIVTQKDGTQYRFGTRDNLDSPDTSLLRWYWVWNSGWQKQYYRFDLGRIIDTHSNYADYTYLSYTANYCPAGASNPTCQTVVKASYPQYINWGANLSADNTHKFRVAFTAAELRADAPTCNQPPVIETRRLTSIKTEVLESGTWKQAGKYSPSLTTQSGTCSGAGALKLSSLAVQGTDSSTLHTYAFGYGGPELAIDYKHASQTCLPLTWPYLQTITNGFGATTTLTYESKWQVGPASADPNCPGGTTVATWSRQVVATRSDSPGVGTPMDHSYTYTTGPRYYQAAGINPIDAEYRGFKVVRDSNGIGVGPFDYTECKHYTTGTEEDGWPGDILTGHAFRCEWFESTGGPSVKLWTPTWSFRYVAANVNFVFLYEDLTYFGSAIDRSFLGFDAYGNLASINEYTPVTRTKSTEFYANTTTWIVGLPAAEITYRGDPNPPYWIPVSKMTYLYDNNSAYDQAPIKGDRVREDHYDDADVAHTRWLWGYDTYGNKTSEIKKRDGTNSLQKTITPDGTYHTYVSTETVTSVTPNQTTSYAYDFVLGKQITKADPNAQQWNTRYDVHGRVDKEWSPGDSETYPTVDYVYNWDSTAPNQTVTKRLERVGTANTLDSWEWKDGLDRTVQTRSEGTTCLHDVMVTDTAYDVTGQVSSRTSPYLSSNVACVAGAYATDISPPKTQYLYDVLGRERQVTNPHQTPVSIRTTTYSGFTEAVIDENGHKTERIKDAFDRVVTVKEYNGTNPDFGPNPTTTAFQYDVLDRQTGVTDHFTNQWTTNYNRLGFVTSTVDPDRGTWSYQYFDDGLLKRESDARLPTPQHIDYEYDSLNRITLKSYSGYLSPSAISYVYDVMPDSYPNGAAAPAMPDGYPVGRLTRVVDWAGEHLHSYDARGRETDERHVISSSTYDVGHAFDSADRELCTVYPDGEKVGSTYDSQGAIETLKQYPSAGCTGATTATYLSSSTSNEASMPAALAYGNGLSNSFSYRTTDWRLTNITASTLLNYTYGYDAKGNINSIGDTVEGTTAAMQYDERGRLDQVTGIPSTTIDYSYDEIGNVLMKREGGSWYTSIAYPSPGLPRPHGLTQANYSGGWHTFEYDENGNTTFERDNAGAIVHQYLYNAEGQVSYMSSPGQSPAIVTYYYDSEGALVRRQPFGQAQGIVYVGEIYERDNLGEVTKYYFVGGQRIAMRKGAAQYFLTQDHLGGTALLSDIGGSMVSRTRYFPYGSVRTQQFGTGYTSIPTDKMFTGQQRETENGIYNYRARFYNSDIGRMAQADSVIPGKLDPAAYNRYSYTRNDPINHTDPTGNWFKIVNAGARTVVVGSGLPLVADVQAAAFWYIGPSFSYPFYQVQGSGGGHVRDVTGGWTITTETRVMKSRVTPGVDDTDVRFYARFTHPQFGSATSTTKFQLRPGPPYPPVVFLSLGGTSSTGTLRIVLLAASYEVYECFDRCTYKSYAFGGGVA